MIFSNFIFKKCKSVIPSSFSMQKFGIVFSFKICVSFFCFSNDLQKFDPFTGLVTWRKIKAKKSEKTNERTLEIYKRSYVNVTSRLIHSWSRRRGGLIYIKIRIQSGLVIRPHSIQLISGSSRYRYSVLLTPPQLDHFVHRGLIIGYTFKLVVPITSVHSL